MSKGCFRTGRVVGIIIGTLFLGLVTSYVATAQVGTKGVSLEWERNNDLLAHQFVHIATTAEIGVSTHYTTKWGDTLIVHFKGNVRDSWIQDVRKHLYLLNGLGVDARLKRPDEPIENVNVWIDFQSREDFDAHARGTWPESNLPNCHVWNSYYTSGPESGKITSGDIFIPDDLPRNETRECIAEEITQLLGLLNDSFALPDTLFNDNNVYDRLSWTDKLFVRLLQKDDVKPGMSNRVLYDVILRHLNKLRPRYRSNNPFSIDFLKNTLAWEQMIKESLQTRESKGGTPLVVKQLSLATRIDPNGMLEALGHRHAAIHYLYIRDYPALLTHAQRSYDLLKTLVDPRSLRLADSLYYLSIAMRYNNRRSLSDSHLESVQKIIDEFWPGNQLTDRITIREIGFLLQNRKFKEVVHATEDYLHTSADSAALDRMNVIYLHGLAELGLANISSSQHDLDTLTRALRTLQNHERSHGELIVDSFRHHFTKIMQRRNNDVNSVKSVSYQPAGTARYVIK